MPEGPEIRIAANFINEICDTHQFSGPVVRGDLAIKLPLVNFSAPTYTLRAESRGKELKVHLCDVNDNDAKKLNKKTGNGEDQPVHTLLFHFGMSGCFKFTPVEDLPKHAHLQFYTKDKTKVLSFVDFRRFGTWKINGDWGSDRGPDPISQYAEFRSNVLSNLNDPAFNRAICEVLLNQRFFNGIGNYLRAEILLRCRIPPFEVARKVLEPIKISDDEGIKTETPDLLELCHLLPLEVVNLEHGKGYNVEYEEDDYSEFMNWLQCYTKEGMKNLVDRNGRTIWFSGPPGPLKPANAKTRGKVNRKKKSEVAENGVESSSSPLKRQKETSAKEFQQSSNNHSVDFDAKKKRKASTKLANNSHDVSESDLNQYDGKSASKWKKTDKTPKKIEAVETVGKRRSLRLKK